MAVLFGPGSKGQLALVIYEWKDAKYLGVDEVDPTEQNEWEDNVRAHHHPPLIHLLLTRCFATQRLYVCTYDAVAKNLCPMSMLGQFITTMPAGVSVNSTSIFTRRVEFTAIGGNETEAGDGMQGPFRYNVTRTGYCGLESASVMPVSLPLTRFRIRRLRRSGPAGLRLDHRGQRQLGEHLHRRRRL